MFKKDKPTEKADKKEKKDKKDKEGKDKDKKKGTNSSASASEEEPSPNLPSKPETSIPKTTPVQANVEPKVIETKPTAVTPIKEDIKKIEEENKKKEEEEKLKKVEEDKKKEEKKKREAKDSSEKKKTTPSTTPVSTSEVKSGENVDAEIHSLESAKLDPTETSKTYKENYNLLPQEVYISYDKLQNFARDLNTQISVPEFVVIGKRSHGKSSIIESFFGEQINFVGPNGATKRPFYLNLINNLSCEIPRCTIKRDPSNKEFDHDIEVKLSEVSSEVAKRNKSVSEEPIILQYEFKNVCNMTIIDTPGLLDGDETDYSKEDRENLILNLCKQNHRMIICVEACRDWPKMEMMNLVKKFDPELSRTTFVYTKFQAHLQTFTSTREVNKFLSGTLPDVKTFFVSVPSDGVRSRFPESDKFQEKIFQSYKRDLNGLEQLQFDKRYENNIGTLNLRKYLLNLTWKSYQESIPRILKHLRAKKSETEYAIIETEKEFNSLDSTKLRSLASNYVVNFLQIIERLIAGTSEGNPMVNGQSLEEEKNGHGDGDWVDLYNRVIRFEPEEWSIPYWDNKLYGGQQFERLLSEYKAVSEHTEISEVTADDVATAAGINKLNNIPNYMWAASDLAQQKSQDAFFPLIEQLTSRAIYIMKRLTDIAEKILDSRKKKWSGQPSVEDIDRYPYFTYHVKDLYYKFVDATAKTCKEKCLDEFYSTRTILWDFTEYVADKNMPLERNDHDETKSAVSELSKELFNSIRDRITKNVLLKFYNFFLVPMQNELWNEIQGKVNSLIDGSLEQIFEVSSTKEKLKNKIVSLQEELDKGIEQDKLFMEYANSFSHPLLILDRKSK